ncbi:MAG TPA: hypothetical protein VM471_09480 [Phenylobacterium sp.]|jgi:hypothetical protein|nr:hypothetical protein [Phenylobacterium sp.]
MGELKPTDIAWLRDQKEGGHCGEGTFERQGRARHNDMVDRLLAAVEASTEGRGEGEPVAWRYRWNDRRYEDSWDYITNKQRSTFKHLQGDAAGQWEIQPLYASPIREPEISRPNGHDWKGSTLGHGEAMCAKCGITNREAAVLGELDVCTKADAILNLAPVGGRGEGWRPISEAPRDGSPILAASTNHEASEVVCWQDGEDSGSLDADAVCEGLVNAGEQKDRFYANPRWFTHWQPLPPPPQEQEEGSARADLSPGEQHQGGTDEA